MKELKEIAKKNRLFITITLLLILLSIVFSILNTVLAHNTIVSINQVGRRDSVETKGQNFIIQFRRPMGSQNVDELIKFTPEVKYSSQWNGRTLLLRVENDLSPNLEYTLTVNKSITDRYGDTLREDYLYKFKTKSTYFYYLKENQIIKRDITSESEEIIYSDPDQSILDFYINGSYLVLIKGEPNHKKAQLINLTTLEKKYIFDQEKHIVQIIFRPGEEQIWALVQDLFKSGNVTVPIGNMQIYNYRIEGSDTRKVNLNSELISIDHFLFSPDGSELLVHESFTDRFSIVNIEDPNIWSPLGKYITSAGYNSSGDSLLFVNVNWANFQDPSWVELRNSSGEIVLSDKTVSSIDPFFIDKYVGFSTSRDKLTNERSIYGVTLVDYSNFENENSTRLNIIFDGYSLEYGNPSPDGRYVLFLGYRVEELQDLFAFEDRANSIPAPPSATIFIYDIESGDILNSGITTSSVKFDN